MLNRYWESKLTSPSVGVGRRNRFHGNSSGLFTIMMCNIRPLGLQGSLEAKRLGVTMNVLKCGLTIMSTDRSKFSAVLVHGCVIWAFDIFNY